jgi:hypothetical protein
LPNKREGVKDKRERAELVIRPKVPFPLPFAPFIGKVGEEILFYAPSRVCIYKITIKGYKYDERSLRRRDCDRPSLVVSQVSKIIMYSIKLPIAFHPSISS